MKLRKNLLALSTLLLLGGWYAALFMVGADKDQGEVYRIMFVHVPVAWCAFVWIITGGVYGALALIRKSHAQRFDQGGQAAMELGTLFSALALATGMIWGRPTWGVWWDWDPRLTSTLVMFLISCGYHILRSYTPDVAQRRNVAAVTAILSGVNVPLVYYSVNLWRSIHQPQTFTRSGSQASADISATLWTNVFLMLFFSILVFGLRRLSIKATERLNAARESL